VGSPAPMDSGRSATLCGDCGGGICTLKPRGQPEARGLEQRLAKKGRQRRFGKDGFGLVETQADAIAGNLALQGRGRRSYQPSRGRAVAGGKKGERRVPFFPRMARRRFCLAAVSWTSEGRMGRDGIDLLVQRPAGLTIPG